MWKLFDDLYIGIPSDLRIGGCVIGEKWTTVRANGNIGIAKTLQLPENPEKLAASFLGDFLRDTANYMKWDNLSRAAVGVAAMNAWYNTKDRADGLGGDCAAPDLSGNVAYIGDYSEKNVFPLPMIPDFDAAGYERLRDFDTVVIAGEALTTRALPKLLDVIGERGNVVLAGYSLPCTALFFAFGMPVRELRGFYSKFSFKVEACSAKNTADPTPGVMPFTVRQETVRKICESAKIAQS